MKLEILKEDPLNILNTTKYVLENAQYVVQLTIWGDT